MAFLLLCSPGDLLDGAHEDVGHDGDPEEAVDESGEVEHGPGPPRPRHLQEDGQEEALVGAHDVVATCPIRGVVLVDVAQLRLVAHQGPRVGGGGLGHLDTGSVQIMPSVVVPRACGSTRYRVS